jgi:hypothetical protein
MDDNVYAMILCGKLSSNFDAVVCRGIVDDEDASIRDPLRRDP